MQALKILFEDEFLLAADKPAGFHSHPPEDKAIRLSGRWNALGILERQIGQKLYPAHRLDRATSGVLLFSKKREMNSLLQRQFQEHTVEKVYYCLVRGAFEGTARLDAPLKSESELQMESACTLATEIKQFTLPIAGPKGDRIFTLVKAEPVTGRYHQIRRHLAQLSVPIVGDKRHGDKKLNREFAGLTGTERMLLRCKRLTLKHPVTQEPLHLRSNWNKDWHQLFDRAGICPL